MQTFSSTSHSHIRLKRMRLSWSLFDQHACRKKVKEKMTRHAKWFIFRYWDFFWSFSKHTNEMWVLFPNYREDFIQTITGRSLMDRLSKWWIEIAQVSRLFPVISYCFIHRTMFEVGITISLNWESLSTVYSNYFRSKNVARK